MATIPGPSLGGGEKVLLSAYAVHKKAAGTVWFTSRKTLWRATDGKAPVQRVEVAWAAVKSFQVLPSSSALLVYVVCSFVFACYYAPGGGVWGVGGGRAGGAEYLFSFFHSSVSIRSIYGLIVLILKSCLSFRPHTVNIYSIKNYIEADKTVMHFRASA